MIGFNESDLSKAVAPPRDTPQQAIDEQRLARTNWQRYTRARDSGHAEYIKIADKSERFYQGDQWEEADLKTLEEAGRPALTINKVLSTVNTILGEQINRRVDIRYKASNEGEESIAEALTKTSMSITDKNQFEWLETEVTANGVIRERGYYDIRMDFDKSYEGEIAISTEHPSEVIPGPDSRSYDPKDWDEVFVTRWMSLDDIEQEYGPEKADSLRAVAASGDSYGQDSFRYSVATFGNNGKGGSSYVLGDTDDEQSKRELKSVRVIERQYFKHTKCYCLVDQQTGKRRELPAGTTGKEAQQLAMMFRSDYFAKTQKKVRWTITCDHVLLHDDWSPYRTFTIIPFFCYYRPGQPFGVVRNLFSPQELLNKLSSQELHIVNTTANSGWIIERGSLNGMDADDIRTKGSATGVVFEVNPGKRAPEKIKPNTIPTGIDRISMKAAINIKEISGVNDAMLGVESAEVSGVALEAKTGRGQVQLQVILDNLAKTRHFVARKLLELIQDFYTEERVVSVTDHADPDQKREQMTINQMQPDGTIANDVTQGEYDVVITTMPARDSFNDTQFAEAINLRKIGVQIPDYRVVQYSHLARKGDIAKELQDLQGLSAPSEEEQKLAQMQRQIQMMGQQLELEKLRAEISELQAEAAFKMAKARDTAGNNEKFLHELESKLQLKREEFELRRRLSALSAMSKLDAIEHQGAQNLNASLFNKITDTALGEVDERDNRFDNV